MEHLDWRDVIPSSDMTQLSVTETDIGNKRSATLHLGEVLREQNRVGEDNIRSWIRREPTRYVIGGRRLRTPRQ